MISPCNDDENEGNISACQCGRGYTIAEDYALKNMVEDIMAFKAFISASNMPRMVAQPFSALSLSSLL
jgi:hypothetical protein